MEVTVRQIADLVKGKVKGNDAITINMLAKTQDATSGQLTFLSNPKYEQYAYSTKADAMLVNRSFAPKKEIHPTLIIVEDPYTSFTLLIEELNRMQNLQKTGIETPSYIGNNCTVGDYIYRGAFSYIGDNVTIGNNVKIYPHAFIGDHVTIGDDTIIHSGAKIYAETRIGKQCTIHSSAILGSDGFGFAPQENGSYKTIPQLGCVVLEDNVSIGANTVIDCATLPGDATTIKSGAKLDNLIQVGHNVVIGKNTVIAAQTGISGSSKIGESCVIAGQVGIVGHLTIANKTSIGGQSGITKSITKEGERIFGYPAFDIGQYFRSIAIFKKLPDLSHRLTVLEKKLDARKNEDSID